MQHNLTQADNAYAIGVRDVVALALKAAAAMPRTGLHSSRWAFAEVALQALAAEAGALIPPGMAPVITPVTGSDSPAQDGPHTCGATTGCS